MSRYESSTSGINTSLGDHNIPHTCWQEWQMPWYFGQSCADPRNVRNVGLSTSKQAITRSQWIHLWKSSKHLKIDFVRNFAIWATIFSDCCSWFKKKFGITKTLSNSSTLEWVRFQFFPLQIISSQSRYLMANTSDAVDCKPTVAGTNGPNMSRATISSFIPVRIKSPQAKWYEESCHDVRAINGGHALQLQCGPLGMKYLPRSRPPDSSGNRTPCVYIVFWGMP